MHTQVPLTCHIGMIAVFFQHFGNGDTITIQITLIAFGAPIIDIPLRFFLKRSRILGHLTDTCLVLIKSGHQTGTRRTRTGCIIELGKANPCRCQLIEIRGHNLTPITTDVGIAHVVYQKDNDIWLLLRPTKGSNH